MKIMQEMFPACQTARTISTAYKN